MLWSADETALDLFARRPARGFITGMRFMDAPVASPSSSGRGSSDSDGYQSRQVVEVIGDDSTPKALVLLHVIAAFLARDSDGNERVYVFDHECELSASALRDILKYKLTTHSRDTVDEPEIAVRKALERVVVFRCRDTFQWLATLNHLHFELLDSSPCPYLMVLNCVGSFLPMDKMLPKSVSASVALTDQVFALLKQFIQHHSPIVVASKRALTTAKGAPDMAEYMPTSWTSQVSKRIQLRRCVGQNGEPLAFEARSFCHGKVCSFSFGVNGFDIEEESVEEPMEEQAFPVPETTESTAAITEADTNAALLWMQ